MNTLTEKRDLAGKAKEKVYRKRFINKLVEHVGATVLQEDGRAQGYKANPGEFHTIRVNKVWGDVIFNSGTDNPYNDEKSKAPFEHFNVIKGYGNKEIDAMAIDRDNIREIPAQAKVSGRADG